MIAWIPRVKMTRMHQTGLLLLLLLFIVCIKSLMQTMNNVGTYEILYNVVLVMGSSWLWQVNGSHTVLFIYGKWLHVGHLPWLCWITTVYSRPGCSSKNTITFSFICKLNRKLKMGKTCIVRMWHNTHNVTLHAPGSSSKSDSSSDSGSII